MGNNNSHWNVASKTNKRMKTKEIVQELLKNKPSLKDDDNRLCTHIWYREIQSMGVDPHKQSAADFLRLYAKGKLTLAPSIKRVRAKLQEQYPEFRGEKYNLRKGKIQEQWRKDLGYEVYK
mgnify:FL=1